MTVRDPDGRVWSIQAPDANWRDRPDMHPVSARGFRASMVSRGPFIEDLVARRPARN